MFRGYNLSLCDGALLSYHQDGKAIFESNQKVVRDAIEAFKDPLGFIDASRLTAQWFPEISADVFISHSHADNDMAVSFAGWLQTEMGLTSFIDSGLWGYVGDLLKEIDEKYCLVDPQYHPHSGFEKLYSYEKCQRSSSHAFMMLSVALSKMIYNAECVIFMNTPNSIPARDYIAGDATPSPWIYSEIMMTRLVRRSTRRRLAEKADFRATEAYHEDLKFSYDVPLDHLTPLDQEDLDKWLSEFSKCNSDVHSLDVLYELKGHQNGL